MDTAPITPFHLADAVVDVPRLEVRFTSGKCVSVQPKVLNVLRVLVARYPHVVSRAELIQEVWLGNAYVGEAALTNAIWQLRQLFEHGHDSAPLIGTIRKTGYQLLIAPEFSVTEITASNVSVSVPMVDSPAPAWSRISSAKQSVYALALFGLAIGASFIFLSRSVSYRDTPAIPEVVWGKRERLTHFPGRELYPRLSPDGKYLAYLQIDDSGERAWRLRNTTSAHDEVIYRSRNELRSPQWFDADHLVFLESGASPTGCRFKRIDVHRKQVAEVGECGVSTSRRFVLSADGQQLISADQGELLIHELQAGRYEQVNRICPDACNASMPIAELAWSPDGRTLAFSRRLSPLLEDVYLWHFHERREQRLTKGLVSIRGLSWFPDQTHLLISHQQFNRREGLLVDLLGRSSPLPLEGFSSPETSQTGELLYHQWVLHHYLGAVSLREPAGILPIAKSFHSNRCPDFHEASQRLLFVSNETGRDQLWFADIDGKNRRQLTDFPRPISCGKWNAHGTKVAFTAQSERFDNDELWLLDVATLSLQQQALSVQAIHGVSWASDDEQLLFSGLTESGDDALFLLNPDSSKWQPLPLQNVTRAQLSNKQLWFTTAKADGVWRTNVDNAASIELVTAECTTVNNWVVVDEKIFCEKRQAGLHRILMVDLARPERPPQLLAELPAGMLAHTGALTYAAEHQRLVLTLDEPAEADIVRVAFATK